MLKLVSHYGHVYVIESEAVAKAVAKRISQDPKLDYFKRLALEALGIAERREEKPDAKAIAKTFFASIGIAKARAMAVGTVVQHRDGTKYVKVAPGKWRRKFEGHTKGAKAVITKIKRQVDSAQSSEEVLQIVLEHKARFQDAQGHPYPWVQELSSYCEARSEELEGGEGAKDKNLAAYNALPHAKNSRETRRGGSSGGSMPPGGGSGDGGGGDAQGKPFDKLREEFKEKTASYLGKAFKNKATGHEAVFSRKTQREMANNTKNSIANGFSVEEHFEVAKQIKELFEGASLEVTHDDIKHGEANVKIERYLSPEITLSTGKKVQACITVKHTLKPDGKSLYSIEAMDIKDALTKVRAKRRRAVPKGTSTLPDSDSTTTAATLSSEEMSKMMKKIRLFADKDEFGRSYIYITSTLKNNIKRAIMSKSIYAWDSSTCYDIRRVGDNRIMLCNHKESNQCVTLKGIDSTALDYLGPVVDVNTPVVYHSKPLRKIDMAALDRALHEKFDKMDKAQLLGYMDGKLFSSVEDSAKSIEEHSLRSACIACEKMNAIVGKNVVKDYHLCKKECKNLSGVLAFVSYDKKELSLCPKTSWVKAEYSGKINDKNGEDKANNRFNMLGDDGKAIEELITHELGHVIDGYDGVTQSCHHITLLRSRKEDTCPSGYGGNIESNSAMLSSYTGDDAHEFFAECTAKYIKYGPESLTKEQRQMVEERLYFLANGVYN